MPQIHIVAIGKKMPIWCDMGVKEYQSRFPKDFQISLTELPTLKRTKTQNTEQIKEKESFSLLNAVNPDSKIITLDQRGKIWDTPQLAKHMQFIFEQAYPLTFIIGGPDGMTKVCLDKADAIWSLSHLTLPHPMVRLILFEQLYRAWSILHNHPYHK